MADGTTKRICEVQVGDQVLSRDPATGKDEAKTVTATIERHAPSVVDVTLRDAKTGKAETLTCTPEHPLFVQGQGWVEAGSVGIGSSIVSRAGPALEVTNLTWEKNKAEELAAGTGSSFGGYTVYNMTVEGDHTFFVGAAGGGTWVHNDCTIHTGSEEEAKATAFDRAGFPESEAYGAKVPLKPLSQSPRGPRGDRTVWEHPYNDNVVSHDPYGHRFNDGGEPIPPHYGVNGPGIDGTIHYTYPSSHDPLTNR